MWWVHLLEALSCDALCKYVLNAMRCESDCGWCTCLCQTDEIEVDDHDAESFRAEGCCGSVEYIDE